MKQAQANQSRPAAGKREWIHIERGRVRSDRAGGYLKGRSCTVHVPGEGVTQLLPVDLHVQADRDQHLLLACVLMDHRWVMVIEAARRERERRDTSAVPHTKERPIPHTQERPVSCTIHPGEMLNDTQKTACWLSNKQWRDLSAACCYGKVRISLPFNSYSCSTAALTLQSTLCRRPKNIPEQGHI